MHPRLYIFNFIAAILVGNFQVDLKEFTRQNFQSESCTRTGQLSLHFGAIFNSTFFLVFSKFRISYEYFWSKLSYHLQILEIFNHRCLFAALLSYCDITGIGLHSVGPTVHRR